MNTKLIYRRIVDSEELDYCLRARYAVYTATRGKGFVTDNNLGIDLDYYDTKAKHYILCEGGQKLMYIRIVQNNLSNTIDIDALQKKYRQQLAIKVEEESLYTLTLPNLPPVVKIWLKDKLSQNIIFYEGSRLVKLSPQSNVKAVSTLWKCVIATNLDVLEKASGLFLVSHHIDHADTYSIYGFQPIPHSTWFNTNGAPTIVSYLDRNNIPEKHKAKLLEYNRLLHDRGFIEI